MAGGKGGSQTSKVEIPEWMDKAAQQNVALGQEIGKIGYTPYYGPDVAALNPMQTAAMQNTSDWARQFGMNAAMPSMPQAQNYGGLSAYSSGNLFDQAVEELRARRPEQVAQIEGLFVNPTVPSPVTSPVVSPVTPAAPAVTAPMRVQDRPAPVGGPVMSASDLFGGGQ